MPFGASRPSQWGGIRRCGSGQHILASTQGLGAHWDELCDDLRAALLAASASAALAVVRELLRSPSEVLAGYQEALGIVVRMSK